jgi:hypothetical protein
MKIVSDQTQRGGSEYNQRARNHYTSLVGSLPKNWKIKLVYDAEAISVLDQNVRDILPRADSSQPNR